MPTKTLTPEILTAAIEGFEQQKLRIDAQIAELRAMLLGGRTEPTATPKVPKGKRRKMSAAARKRIGDAQRKRWAESKKPAATPSQAVAAPEPKRKLSAAGKRAIAEGVRKRWAAFHDAKAAAKPSEAKKRATKKTASKKAAAKVPVKVAAKKTAKSPQTKMRKAPAAIPSVAAH